MTAMTGTFPTFHPHDVVLPQGVGWPYVDLVDELRRSACRHAEEDERTRVLSLIRPPTDEV